MRITFVIPHAGSAGGIRVVAIYARQLRLRGHHVTVVSTPRMEPSFRHKVRRLLTEGKWPQPKPRGVSHLDGVDVVHHVIDRWRPVVDRDVPDGDVIVATWWETAEWVWALSPSKGVKVHFMQDYEVWNGQADRVDATCRLPMPKITTAQWLVKLLEEKFAFTDVAIAPNAVDLEQFHARPRGKQQAPTVGFTYTPFRNKGCDIVLGACEAARKTLPDLKIVSFGSSKLNPDLPMPADAHYFHCAPDEKLPEIYAMCDAWLFGTRIEGFGLPILEAMACRTPVIGTPAGCAPEILPKGGGILVPHENPVAMAEAIVRLSQLSEAAWREISDKAWRTVSRYTWQDATDIFEAALCSAVERKTGPSAISA